MVRPSCIKPKSEWSYPTGPPETETVYKMSFNQNYVGGGCRPNPIRPRSNFHVYGDGNYYTMDTVYKNSFQNIDTERADKVQPIRHTSTLTTSKERPESSTVYKLSYIPNGLSERQTPIRPTENLNLNLKTNAPFDATTTQRETYVEQPFCKSEPIVRKESNNIKPQGRMECETVYNLSYVPLQGGGRQMSFKPMNQYQRPSDPIDTNTTQRLSYVPHSMKFDDMPLPCKPTSDFTLFGNEHLGFDTVYKNSFRMVQAERPTLIKHKPTLGCSKDRPESNTVYKLSFGACDGYSRPQPFRPVENLGVNPELPFHGVSTQKQDFVPLPFCKRDPIHYKESNLRTGGGPVESKTVYKLSYMPVEAGHRPRSFKPVSQYQMPSGRVETGTTYKLSYANHKNDHLWWGARQEPIIPNSEFKLFGDGDHGDFNTIYKNSYFPVQGKRSAPIRHRDNLTIFSGEAPQSNTVYQLSYIPNQSIERPRPIRPKENEWKSDDDRFEGYTTTKLDYVHQPYVRTEPIRHRDSQIQWSGPMDKRTVYSLSYMPVQRELTRSFKPENRYEKPDEPMETNTTYKNTFVPHVLPEREINPWMYRRNVWERPQVPMETTTIQKLSYLPPCEVQA